SDDTLVNLAGGLISTTGDDARGIWAFGDDHRVVNEAGAMIVTGTPGTLGTGVDADGIRVTGNGMPGTSTSSVDNRGTITTHGNDSDGIASEGNFQLITNSGSILTHGGVIFDTGTDIVPGAQGIEVAGDGNRVYNEGTITTSGHSGHGLAARGNDNLVSNQAGATIDASGLFARGMTVRGDDNRLVNDGAILTSGNSGDGMSGAGDYNTFDNSGSITTT